MRNVLKILKKCIVSFSFFSLSFLLICFYVFSFNCINFNNYSIVKDILLPIVVNICVASLIMFITDWRQEKHRKERLKISYNKELRPLLLTFKDTVITYIIATSIESEDINKIEFNDILLDSNNYEKICDVCKDLDVQKAMPFFTGSRIINIKIFKFINTELDKCVNKIVEYFNSNLHFFEDNMVAEFLEFKSKYYGGSGTRSSIINALSMGSSILISHFLESIGFEDFFNFLTKMYCDLNLSFFKVSIVPNDIKMKENDYFKIGCGRR